MAPADLLFYKQFLLGPEWPDHLPSWTKTHVGRNLKLATHPELNIIRVAAGESSLILIGSILDPSDPAATDVDILSQLLGKVPDFNALIEATYGYGGRWILLVTQSERSIMFHDALGLRQIYYTDVDRVDVLWAMSQPGIVAGRFAFELSEDARDYIASDEFQANPEYRWPCEGGPFIELKQLLPNHYLDLNSGKCHRYWPCSPLEQVSFDQALQTLSTILPQLVTAAATRFDIALGITAGLDSRLVLAACKGLGGSISGISVRQNAMADNHPDICVPARLLGKLKLRHKIITPNPRMSPEFARLFRQNVFMAHDHYGPDVEAISEYTLRQAAAITGSGAEVGKCSYSTEFRNALPEEVTATMLSQAVGMGTHRFPTRHFNNWLKGLGRIYNVNTADLFQWEHAHGNWLAMTQLQFDLAWHEIITPYNCREVLTTFLSVPEQYRTPPECVLYRRIIETLWPELLSVPINPDKQRSLLVRVKNKVKNKVKGKLKVFLHA